MPLYMDFHVGQGLTAEDVANAHQLDLAVQDELNCNCLTYWFDEGSGSAYCLIEAPNKETAVEVHNRSHKQLPDEIIEVDKRVVKAFLGRVIDPAVVDYIIDNKIKVFNDPAFRVILTIAMLPKRLLIHKYGEEKSNTMLTETSGFISKAIGNHKGVTADSSANEFIATFESPVQAYLCAMKIMDNQSLLSKDLNLRMTVHAGNPVDGDPELFGATLKQSRFLCNESKDKMVNITYTVDDLLQKSGINVDRKKIRCLSKEDEGFLKKLIKILHDNWQDPEFDIKIFSKDLLISKSQLYRKCIKLTGHSPNNILNNFRLNQAIKILDSKGKNIAETTFDTGFNSPSYFTKCFHKRFGINPNNYLKTQMTI